MTLKVWGHFVYTMRIILTAHPLWVNSWMNFKLSLFDSRLRKPWSTWTVTIHWSRYPHITKPLCLKFRANSIPKRIVSWDLKDFKSKVSSKLITWYPIGRSSTFWLPNNGILDIMWRNWKLWDIFIGDEP